MGSDVKETKVMNGDVKKKEKEKWENEFYK